MQVIPHRNALVELPHLAQRQLLPQFGLPNQDHLQQFAVVGFEIREHPQLLKHRQIHILRFVNDDHGIVPGGKFLEQILIERVDIRLSGRFLAREAKVAQNGL